MSTPATETSRTTLPRGTDAAAPGRGTTVTRSLRRVGALARAELKLLVRNRTALFTALVLPILTVFFLQALGMGDDSDMPVGAFLISGQIAFLMLLVVYYNLVAAYVARREDLVLKRLRTGEATDGEIMAGTAVPALVVTLVQVVLVGIGASLLLGLDMPVNIVLVLVAIAGGAVVFTLLAAASTAFTRNVEMAQVSTMPVLLVCMFFSGLVMPIDALPGVLATAARVMPLTPVVELSQLGMIGTTGGGAPVDFAGSFAEAAEPTVILLAWIVIGVFAVRRWFRWEPRR